MPQRITVMAERTIKSFGVYSYLGGWVAITGYCMNNIIIIIMISTHYMVCVYAQIIQTGYAVYIIYGIRQLSPLSRLLHGPPFEGNTLQFQEPLLALAGQQQSEAPPREAGTLADQLVVERQPYYQLWRLCCPKNSCVPGACSVCTAQARCGPNKHSP